MIRAPRHLRKATNFFARELNITHCNIKVVHKSCPELFNSSYAFVERFEDEDEVLYIISINKDVKDAEYPLLECLAHEMLHIEQHETGRLVDVVVGDKVYSQWDGGPLVDAEKFSSVECSGYWDMPWEVDAYGRQEELYERWLRR